MAFSPNTTKSGPTPRIRLVTREDKDVWIDVMLAGYEVDPQFQWRYPHRRQFPEDARKATGDVFETVLGIESMTCLVAELPKIEDNESESPEWVVVAVAIWEWKDWEEVESESGNSISDPIICVLSSILFYFIRTHVNTVEYSSL